MRAEKILPGFTVTQWFSTFSLKGAKSILNTYVDWHICFTAERSLLHKILEVLLKDCWGPPRPLL